MASEQPLDNNHDEQLIRPTTIGRKNYLFAKTEAGAEANAIWYTFIQTVKSAQSTRVIRTSPISLCLD